MATLYRKYRPKNFKEVFGQKPIKLTIENQIKLNKLGHAYLFCGPRAVGKTTLARIMSKAVNCTERKKGESEPCNKCDICLEISQGRNLDIIEIDGASNNKIDNVRDNIIAGSFVAPSRCKYKIFIIDEVHMLTTPAFNALLKTLEEPPENVLFILCTTEVHKMPSTIISRCQRFDFKKISINDIVGKLEYVVQEEGIEVESGILETIARQSEGHMRDAESILNQIVAISDKKITKKEVDLVLPRSDINEIVSLIDMLAKNDVANSINLINRLIDNGVDLKSFIKDLIEMLRRIMIGKVNTKLSEKLGMELGENLEIKVNSIIKNLELNRIIEILNKFIVARNELKNSFIPQLPIEIAIIDLCGVKNDKVEKVVFIKQNFSSTSSGNIPQSDSIKEKIVKSELTQKQNTDENNVKIEKTLIQKQDAGNKVNDDNIKENVLRKWSEIIKIVKANSSSLHVILRVCSIKKVTKDVITIVFKHKFHYTTFNNNEVKSNLSKVILDVCGYDLKINAVLDEKGQGIQDKNKKNKDIMIQDQDANKDDGASKSDKEFLNDVLDTFNGTLV